MTENTTHPGDRDPGADPADEWDRETTPGQTLATAMRTAVAAQRDLAVLKDTSVYIAGPMTSVPDFNFPAFRAVADDLIDMGFGEIQHTAVGTPPSPTEAKPWETYLRDALRCMLACDAVVALSGWRESKGARLEIHVALELGVPVVEYPDLRPVEYMQRPIRQLLDDLDREDPIEIVTYGGKETRGSSTGSRPAPTTRRWTPVDPEDVPHWSDATMSTPPVVVPSDDETEAEYIERRYGGVDPRTGHHIKPEDPEQ